MKGLQTKLELDGIIMGMAESKDMIYLGLSTPGIRILNKDTLEENAVIETKYPVCNISLQSNQKLAYSDFTNCIGVVCLFTRRHILYRHVPDACNLLVTRFFLTELFVFGNSIYRIDNAAISLTIGPILAAEYLKGQIFCTRCNTIDQFDFVSLRHIKCLELPVRIISFALHKDLLIVGTFDGKIIGFNADLVCLFTFNAHMAQTLSGTRHFEVTCLKSGETDRLLSSGSDGMLKEWKFNQGKNAQSKIVADVGHRICVISEYTCSYGNFLLKF